MYILLINYKRFKISPQPHLKQLFANTSTYTNLMASGNSAIVDYQPGLSINPLSRREEGLYRMTREVTLEYCLGGCRNFI